MLHSVIILQSGKLKLLTIIHFRWLTKWVCHRYQSPFCRLLEYRTIMTESSFSEYDNRSNQPFVKKLKLWPFGNKHVSIVKYRIRCWQGNDCSLIELLGRNNFKGFAPNIVFPKFTTETKLGQGIHWPLEGTGRSNDIIDWGAVGWHKSITECLHEDSEEKGWTSAAIFV